MISRWALVLLGLVSAAAAAQPPLKEYDAPGTRLRAGFAPVKAELVWGEPIQMDLVIENIGQAELKFLFGGDYRGRGRHDRFKISVKDGQGNLLPDPRANGFDMGGLMNFVTVAPGKSYNHRVDLTQFRTFPGPGTYAVECSFGLDERVGAADAKNPVISSTFSIAILQRTPQRVRGVLDELSKKAQAAKGEELASILDLMGRFGEEEGIQRLLELARGKQIDQRMTALNTLSALAPEKAVAPGIEALADPDAKIRMAAAGALGATRKAPAVEALLKSLPDEKAEVAASILRALGNSRSDRALPALVEALDQGDPQLLPAAVEGLAILQSPRAIEQLKLRLESDDPLRRYLVVQALVEKLREPLKVDWLLPVLMGREMNHPWIDSIRLVRLYGGEKAIPALLSCLDFDVPWSWRNWWILETGVKPCPNAPRFEYVHDPNREATPQELDANARSLAMLKKLAGPVTRLQHKPKIAPEPLLAVDPPIDFEPEFRPVKGGVEIVSGFLKLSLQRNGSSMQYSPSPDYQKLYRRAGELRWLMAHPELFADLEITPEQAARLRKLPAGNLPQEFHWHELYVAWLEAPPALKGELEQELKDAVRVTVQHYHQATATLVEQADEILTHSQIVRLPAEMERWQARERSRLITR